MGQGFLSHWLHDRNAENILVPLHTHNEAYTTFCNVSVMFFSEKVYHNKIPEMAPIPSPSLKIPKIWICKYFSFHKFNWWTQYVSYFTVKSISVYVHWILQVSTSHLCRLNIGPGLASLLVMSQIMLIGSPLKIKFSVKIYTFKISC